MDDRSIKLKREGSGPTGNGGNGLILHSALAIEPQQGQTWGLLWQKLWNREQKPKPPKDETPKQKKPRQASARKAACQRPFREKESYKWVEALIEVDKQVEGNTRVIQIFDHLNSELRIHKGLVRMYSEFRYKPRLLGRKRFGFGCKPNSKQVQL